MSLNRLLVPPFVDAVRLRLLLQCCHRAHLKSNNATAAQLNREAILLRMDPNVTVPGDD